MVLNKSLQVGITMVCMANLSIQLTKLQEINVQNMNVELVAQMFKNYQSNVLFHLEGQSIKICNIMLAIHCHTSNFSANNNDDDSHRQPEGAGVISQRVFRTVMVHPVKTQSCRCHIYLILSWRARGDRSMYVYGRI